jgi:hypothetical protein
MLEVFRNVGWEDRLGPQRIFPEAAALWSSTQDAVRRAYELLDVDKCVTCPNRREDGAQSAVRDFVI